VWLLTTTGFLSVVTYDPGPEAPALPLPDGAGPRELLLVRARVETDLTAMLDALELPRSRTASTPTADYPYRAVLTREEWGRYISQETQRVDYPNFKARVLELQGSHRHDVYSRVWATLRSLESTAGRDRGDEPPEDSALW
jgi:hypothetical protein